MRPAIRRLTLLGALLALVSCLDTQQGQNPFLEGQTVRLTVLHTTDMHSRLLPYDLAPLKTDSDLGLAPEAPPYGGVARMAALIRREKEHADRVVLLDSGDQFQGGPIFNANDGEPEIRWMSHMNYDAVAMGNHEFDKGVQNFTDKIQRFGRYPLLAANYLWENTNAPNAHGLDKYSAPYTLVNAGGIRVGIIGMGSTSSMYGLMDGGNSLQAIPLEQNETVRSYLELLRPVTDLIVVLSHLGLTEDQDLLTGYDAYYPYENAKPFLTRKNDPWIQIEPPPGPTPDQPNTLPDGTVRVFIPGVSGIDVIEGGHLHIVLNPPQVIRDPSGRPVIISHSGAFAKYLGRLDLEVQMPPAKPDAAEDSPEMQAWYKRKAEGAEVVAHSYHAFPVDAIWCDDEARSWRSQVQSADFANLIKARPKFGAESPATSCRERFWSALPEADTDRCMAIYDADYRDFDCDLHLPIDCMSRVERCRQQEDRKTTDLLQPYILQLDTTFALPRIFAFAPREIARRNSSTGGDSPLGNMTAESMKVRRRVEAEFSLTNTLGIRDNLYPGPVTLESMFNVFPFENTINIMYLSGAEVHELTDYVASRSSDRGCQAQAQVAGIHFVMDCAQAQRNLERHACDVDDDCQQFEKPQEGKWRCTEEKVCWASPSYGLTINGQPVNPGASYKIAVNDYIAKGGSGFKVLKRNTTRIETGISLRDSLIDWLRGQCTCEDILGLNSRNTGLAPEKRTSEVGYLCARAVDNGNRLIDPIAVSWCKQADAFEKAFQAFQQDPNHPAKMVEAPPVAAGKCNCQEVINGDEKSCGHVTNDLRNFCSAPTKVPIAIGEEDGRIGRRVK